MAVPPVASERPRDPAEAAALELGGVLRLLRDPDAPSNEVLAPRLAKVVPPILERVFHIIEQRSIPATTELGPQLVSTPQEALILDTLALLDAGGVQAELAALYPEPSSVAERYTMISVLGAVSRANRLQSIVALSLLEEEQALDRRLRAALQRAVTAVLRRDPSGFDVLGSGWSGWSPELLPYVLMAVGESEDPRGLAFLGEVVRWRVELAPAALAQIPRLVEDGADPRAHVLADTVRPLLDRDNDSTSRAACLALGALEDYDSVPLLLDLLNHDVPGMRNNAHWALQRLTGRSLSMAPALWRAWYVEEERWLRRGRAQAFADLGSRRVEEVVCAVREISRHRLYRHELARELTWTLQHASPHIRILTCRALAELGSSVAVLELIALLDDIDEDVATAAWTALKAITDLDLPQDPEAWLDHGLDGAL